MNSDNTFIAYRMGWIKCGMMTLSAGIAAWVTAMDGVIWTTLNGTEQVKVIAGCLIVMFGIVVAFLDRTISRIESERAVIPGTKEHQIATGTGDGNG